MTKEEKKELEKLTRTKLVEEAKKYPDIVGASGMKKEELLAAVREEMKKGGEEMSDAAAKTERAPGAKVKKGPTRQELKAFLAALKRDRQVAIDSKDHVQLKRIRSRYKKVNRSLRRTAAAKA